VADAAKAAGLGKASPHDVRRSFCSLAGRRGVDPVEAARLTGHSLVTWTAHYARSYGKAQRDEARERLLAFGFGADIALTQERASKPETPPMPRESLQIEKRTMGLEPTTLGLGSQCSTS
jgi:hypothetical protein